MIKQIFEIIPSKRSSNEALVTYVNFLTNFKKLSVFTGNSVGYMNNKILEPCLLESLSLIEEGVEPERIDKVLVNRLGLRAGPFHSIDLSGIEIKDLNDRKIKLENLFNEYQIELFKSKDEKPKLRKQPSTLPDDEIKDEEKVITIKVPVVLSNWYSDLLYKIYNANLKGSSILGKEGIPSGFYDYKGKGLAPNPAAKEVIEKHRVDMVRSNYWFIFLNLPANLLSSIFFLSSILPSLNSFYFTSSMPLLPTTLCFLHLLLSFLIFLSSFLPTYHPIFLCFYSSFLPLLPFLCPSFPPSSSSFHD